MLAEELFNISAVKFGLVPISSIGGQITKGQGRFGAPFLCANCAGGRAGAMWFRAA
jgi:hypothetical protein